MDLFLLTTPPPKPHLPPSWANSGDNARHHYQHNCSTNTWNNHHNNDARKYDPKPMDEEEEKDEDTRNDKNDSCSFRCNDSLRQKIFQKERNAQIRRDAKLHQVLIKIAAHHLHVERVRRLSKNSSSSSLDSASSSEEDAHFQRYQEQISLRVARARRNVERAKHICRKVRASTSKTILEQTYKSEEEQKLLEAQSRYNLRLTLRVSRAKRAVDRAKCISQRVRAARLLQTTFRKFANENVAVDEKISMMDIKVCDATRCLTKIFHNGRDQVTSDQQQRQATFEEVTMAMQSPHAIQSAVTILNYSTDHDQHDFIHSLPNKNTAKAEPNKSNNNVLTAREFLSALLISMFPMETLGGGEDEENEEEDVPILPAFPLTGTGTTTTTNASSSPAPTSATTQQKAQSKHRKRILDTWLKRVSTNIRHSLFSLDQLLTPLTTNAPANTTKISKRNQIRQAFKSRIISFSVLFRMWKKWDFYVLLTNMKELATNTWICFLVAKSQLSTLLEPEEETTITTSNTNQFRTDFVTFRVQLQHEMNGAKMVLQKMRKRLNGLLKSAELGRMVMVECKTLAQKRLQEKEELENANKPSQQKYQQREQPLDNSDQSTLCSLDKTHSAMATGTATTKHTLTASTNIPKPETKRDVDSRNLMHNKNPKNATMQRNLENVISNLELVHTILLTDDDQYHTLTWNNVPRVKTIGFMEFFERWHHHQGSSLRDSSVAATVSTAQNREQTTGESKEDVTHQIEITMQRAYFDIMMEELQQILQSNTMTDQSFMYSKSIMEMNSLIQGLIPNRKDLHGILSDNHLVIQGKYEDDGKKQPHKHNDECSSMAKQFLIPLLRAARALSMLESPDRSVGTLEWIQLVNEASNTSLCTNSTGKQPKIDIPFCVISMAYLFFQIQLCQNDIANTNLIQVASHLHTNDIGIEYERTKFQTTYSKFDVILASLSNKEASPAGNAAINDHSDFLLPNTLNWVKRIFIMTIKQNKKTVSNNNRQKEDYQQQQQQQDKLVLSSSPTSYEQRMTTLKTCGFVNELLFTQSSLSLPEIFNLDISRIMQIRQMAQVAVMGSALVIHARRSAVSIKVGGVCCRMELDEDGGDGACLQKDKENLVKALLDHLQKRAGGTGDEEGIGKNDVLKAVVALAEAIQLSRSSCPVTLSGDSLALLQNCAVAVLNGEDPVLKLLDNRVRQFFRFACKWQEPASSISSCKAFSRQHQKQQAPTRMKTGRVVVVAASRGNSSTNTTAASSASKPSSTPNTEIMQNAMEKEALRQGFSFFALDLAEAGIMSHKIVNLMCDIYGLGLLNDMVSHVVSSQQQNNKKYGSP